jgi:hypothetical protein
MVKRNVMKPCGGELHAASQDTCSEVVAEGYEQMM